MVQMSANGESFFEMLSRLEGAETSMTKSKNPDIIRTLELRGDFTPDFGIRHVDSVKYPIRQYSRHLVFIYDYHMRRTGVNNSLLKDSDAYYLGDAYSASVHSNPTGGVVFRFESTIV